MVDPNKDRRYQENDTYHSEDRTDPPEDVAGTSHA